jgi:hypothetical protein
VFESLALVLLALGVAANDLAEPVAGQLLADHLHRQFPAAPGLEVSIDRVDLLAGRIGGIRGNMPASDLAWLPVAAARFRVDEVAFDWPSLLQGKGLRALGQVPVHASLAFSAAELTRMVQADQVRNLLKGFTVPRGMIPGMALKAHLDIVPTAVELAEGTITLEGQLQVPELELALPFQASVRPVRIDATHILAQDTRVSVMGHTIGGDRLGPLFNQTLDLQAVPLPVPVELDRLQVYPGQLALDLTANLPEATASP